MALTKTPIELSSTPSIVDGGNATAITIDSSENVLVGKTALTIANEGVVFEKGGAAEFTTDAARVMRLNRTSSDGSVLEINKDGTAVGKIGCYSGDLTIGNASTVGLIFEQTGADRISPWNLSTNATRDGEIDLGDSDQRWKDIYLSGGAYLGGTAAANKLDDYEEGTWTPVPVGLGDSGGTYSGFYTKTGRIVNWSCYIVLPSTSDTSFGVFGGFPFASTGGQGTTGNSGVSYKNSATDLQILINQSTATMFWYNSTGSQQTYANFSGKSLYMGGSYITDL